MILFIIYVRIFSSPTSNREICTFMLFNICMLVLLFVTLCHISILGRAYDKSHLYFISHAVADKIWLYLCQNLVKHAVSHSKSLPAMYFQFIAWSSSMNQHQKRRTHCHFLVLLKRLDLPMVPRFSYGAQEKRVPYYLFGHNLRSKTSFRSRSQK